MKGGKYFSLDICQHEQKRHNMQQGLVPPRDVYTRVALQMQTKNSVGHNSSGRKQSKTRH